MSVSPTGVLPLLAPAWAVLIVSGLLLNSVLHWKAHLPKLVRDILEYGKLREKKATSLLSLPKRCGWACVIYNDIAHHEMQVVHPFLCLGVVLDPEYYYGLFQCCPITTESASSE